MIVSEKLIYIIQPNYDDLLEKDLRIMTIYDLRHNYTHKKNTSTHPLHKWPENI